MRTQRDLVHQFVQLNYPIALICLLLGVVVVPVVAAGHPQQSTSGVYRPVSSLTPKGDALRRQEEAKAKAASEAQSQIVDLLGQLEAKAKAASEAHSQIVDLLGQLEAKAKAASALPVLQTR